MSVFIRTIQIEDVIGDTPDSSNRCKIKKKTYRSQGFSLFFTSFELVFPFFI